MAGELDNLRRTQADLAHVQAAITKTADVQAELDLAIATLRKLLATNSKEDRGD